MTSSTDDETRAEPVVVTERGPLHLDYVGTSHVGLIRKNNQDSGYASPTMLLVADGMGGAAAGDLASAVAVKAAVADDALVLGDAMLDVLGETVRRANDKIADLVADDHTLEGMGTTVSGALFDGARLGLCHIGDSRVYLVRDGELERLTHDHSWVQSLVDDGKISEEEAAFHPHRSLLLKVLNGHPTNVPDSSLTEVRAGDRLILCSDGLCGLIDDPEILEIATEEESIQAVLDDLVEAALQAGGVDNITVIVADVTETQPEPALEPLIMGAATERDIPVIAPRTVDLGDEEVESDDDPVRPNAPPPPSSDDEQDEEAQRYAMSEPPKRRWLTRLITLIAVGLLLTGAVIGGAAWGRTQFYIGAANQNVAIYQGLPQDVLGLPLSQVYEIQEIPLSDLPRFYRAQVEAGEMRAGSLEQAKASVDELAVAAERCRAARTPPPPPETTAPPPPSTTPTPNGSPSPSANPGQTSAPTSPAPSTPAPSTPAPSTPATTSTAPPPPGPGGECP
ncbi:PP2C family protein-serine/threonine phosphatase [Microlunatus sp. Y2014]|uniref:PP2C family protein-serine/threonine phosphatase n=1 Tax=Microlunatus sp. Y2014 TaxID=3418488 RepID=UPI003DA701CE